MRQLSHWVKGEPLPSLPYVELLECYPQDVGHDMFEGVNKYILTHISL